MHGSTQATVVLSGKPKSWPPQWQNHPRFKDYAQKINSILGVADIECVMEVSYQVSSGSRGGLDEPSSGLDSDFENAEMTDVSIHPHDSTAHIQFIKQFENQVNGGRVKHKTVTPWGAASLAERKYLRDKELVQLISDLASDQIDREWGQKHSRKAVADMEDSYNDHYNEDITNIANMLGEDIDESNGLTM